jgi:hypothetical protein
VNDELERIWKEAVVAYFNALIPEFAWRYGENHKLIEDSRSHGRDLKLGTPENESVALTTQPRRSV